MQSKLAKIATVMTTTKAITDHDNGLGGNAPCMESYAGAWMGDDLGWDAHATHGLVANDGGFVAVGGGLYTNEKTADGRKGFVMKTKGTSTCSVADGYTEITASGSGCTTWDWVYNFGEKSKTAGALWVAESPDKTYFIAVGVTQHSGGTSNQMWIGKLQASDGTLVWDMTYGTGIGNGAESVAFLSDGSFVIGGYINGSGFPTFKSGGQVDSGTPFMAKVSAADAAGSTTPSSFEWAHDWTDLISQEYAGGSAKSIRVDSSDNIYFIGGKHGIAKLTSAGAVTWKHQTVDSTAQYNDLEVNSDGTIILTGHQYGSQTDRKRCWFTNCGTIVGYMTKLKTDGTVDWSKTYGNYKGGVNQFAGAEEADDPLVYTECWGIAKTYASDLTTHDGYALACGTGIEGCQFWAMKPVYYSECLADSRTTWRALTVATDLNGDRVWHRQDSYQTGESKVSSSASEFIFVNKANGKLTMITDEANGMGIATMEAYNNVLCTDTYLSAVRYTSTALAMIGFIVAQV